MDRHKANSIIAVLLMMFAVYYAAVVFDVCGPVAAQQSETLVIEPITPAAVPTPAVASEKLTALSPRVSDIGVSTVFGTEFPALKPGQILIQRHMYTAAIDPVAKQPVWIQFRVCRADWDSGNVLSRNFHTPAALKPFALEESDYRESGFDMGHMYGLQFVSAATHAAEVNEVTVIAAQRPELNRQLWVQMENRIKDWSKTRPVDVLNGLLWIDPMPPLPNADEPHKLASHFWAIVSPKGQPTEAYLFDQNNLGGNNAVDNFKVGVTDLKEIVSDNWTSTLEGANK